MEFQQYPRWMYGPNNQSVIVQDREGEDALGEGWTYTPQSTLTTEQIAAAAGAQDPAAEKAAEESKSPWLVRATEVGLEPDRRWSVQTLKTKVLEAEAAKRA